jgi:hypothetical protein
MDGNQRLSLALGAFLRLESRRLRTGVFGFEAITVIIRDAIRAFLPHPLYCETATA